jgi:hypothetical protein
LEQTEVDMFPIYNRFTTYPFGVSGLTHAVNFNKTHRFTNVEYDFRDTEDLYDVYYKEYIDDLINSDNKILVANFYLLPEEIASLKGSEKIFINNNYYRINKINNYNLTNRDIVEVELLKLTGDYDAHRKKCYLLRACDDPADIIYVNTDLNWTLYAYAGKKFKLNGFCYQIEEDICDDTKNYQRITLPFIEGSFQPETYNDCGCYTLSDSVNIYNDFSGTTINPTPTPTPTAPQEQYYYYTMSKCDEQILFLGRSTNFYSGGTIVRTNASSDVCWIIDGLVSIPNTNDITTTYINCDTCAADVPTPTPTPTKTPTPTPTFVCTCKTYQINNDNSINAYIDYKDCNGVNQTRNVSPGQFFYICACNGTMSGTADFSVVGDCVPTSPTPTPTTTKTPTPTPTTTLAPAPPPESPTPTPSITASPTPTNTLTPTPTSSLTPTPTSSLTPTPSITATNTQTPTPSISPTQTATPTITPTNTTTPTNTQTPTNTPTNTTTSTPTPTITPTITPSSCVLDPSVVPGLFAWYDIQDPSTITTSGLNLLSVNDKSGNGYTLQSPVGSVQYINSTTTNLTTKKCISISGSSSIKATLPSVNISAGSTMFVVYGKTATIGGSLVQITSGTTFGSTPSQNMVAIFNGNGFFSIAGNGARHTSTCANVIGQAFIIGASLNNTTISNFNVESTSVNCSTIVLQSTGTTASAYTLLGIGTAGSQASQILEVIVYDNILTTNNYTCVLNYLNNKYGYSTWV